MSVQSRRSASARGNGVPVMTSIKVPRKTDLVISRSTFFELQQRTGRGSTVDCVMVRSAGHDLTEILQKMVKIPGNGFSAIHEKQR